MCFLKPLKIIKLNKNTAVLENGIKAYYDKKIGKIILGDTVLVYGNIIINKIKNYEKQPN